MRLEWRSDFKPTTQLSNLRYKFGAMHNKSKNHKIEKYFCESPAAAKGYGWRDPYPLI
jgi:hypothetical protein